MPKGSRHIVLLCPGVDTFSVNIDTYRDTVFTQADRKVVLAVAILDSIMAGRLECEVSTTMHLHLAKMTNEEGEIVGRIAKIWEELFKWRMQHPLRRNQEELSRASKC